MKYTLERTEQSDLRVNVSEGKAWLLYIVQGGSGLEIKELSAGDSWREGSGEEFVGIYESREEAQKAADKY